MTHSLKFLFAGGLAIAAPFGSASAADTYARRATKVCKGQCSLTSYLPYVGDEVHVTINFEGIKQ